MRRWTVDRIALGLIAVFMLPTALQASLQPESWYDDFPLGRGWIAMEGEPYNEHLVRDVGVLLLALILATVWTIVRKLPTAPIAAAWLLQGAVHVAYHTAHLDDFETGDAIGLVLALGSIPVLAAVALWAGRKV